MMDIKALRYCLNEGFSAPLIEALYNLASKYLCTDETLQLASDEWDRWTPRRYVDVGFEDVIYNITSKTIYECSDCGVWTFDDREVEDDRQVCPTCIANYECCSNCDTYVSDDSLTRVDDSWYCDSCLDQYASYCEECEEYYHYDDHNHGCECEAPLQCFTFPANGDGTVKNDERLEVALPAGTISDEGLDMIVGEIDTLLRDCSDRWMGSIRETWKLIEEVGDKWVAKRGNFTRRLSSVLYKSHAVKIPPEILTKIGNIARQHSGDVAEWNVEFTRNLNLPAEAFYHEDSCWWQSYYESRCALKSWGGIGMRTFSDRDYYPDGRAWIQPLNDELGVTADALGARAYVIYNGYGDLSGATPARIIAHLTGKTYKKISYYPNSQYVNGDVGWLVSDETTCAKTASITIHHDCHYRP